MSVNRTEVAVGGASVSHMKSYDDLNDGRASVLAPRGFRPGQTMTEFAIVATVLLLATFAIFNFGMVIYSYSMVTFAANDAVRWASVRGGTYTPPNSSTPSPATAGQVLTHVEQAMPTLSYTAATSTCPTDTTSGALEVCTQWSAVGGNAVYSPGSIVQVQVEYNFPLTIPFLSPITLPLSAYAQMAISQ